MSTCMRERSALEGRAYKLVRPKYGVIYSPNYHVVMAGYAIAFIIQLPGYVIDFIVTAPWGHNYNYRLALIILE